MRVPDQSVFRIVFVFRNFRVSECSRMCLFRNVSECISIQKNKEVSKYYSHESYKHLSMSEKSYKLNSIV